MSIWNHAKRKGELFKEIRGIEYVRVDVDDALQILNKGTLTEQDIEDLKSSLICIRKNLGESIDGLINVATKI